MNHKIITTIFLLPIISYTAINTTARDARLKELENIKSRNEWQAVQLGSKIVEEQEKLITYKETVFTLLCENRNNKNKEIMSRERFNSFILQLCGMFAQGEDIKLLVEKAPFYRANTEVPMHLIVTGLVIQQLFVKSLMDQYSQEAEELRLINKNLYQSSKA